MYARNLAAETHLGIYIYAYICASLVKFAHTRRAADSPTVFLVCVS